jgi:hypothetical protein
VRVPGRSVVRKAGSAFVVVGMLLAGAASPRALAAPESVRLAYQLVPGASYEQAMTMSMKLQMEMEGLPPESAALAQAMLKDLRQEMSMRVNLDMGSEESDGSVPFKASVSDVKMSMTMAGQPMEVPNLMDSLKELVTNGRQTADGRLAEVDFEGLENVPGLPAEFKDNLLRSLPEIPARDLKVGDTFEIPYRMAVPALPTGGKVDVDAKAIYTLKRIAETEAFFDVRQTMSMGTGGPGSEELGMSIAGGGLGTAVFDLKEGFFKHLRIDTRMEVKLEMAIPGAPEGAAPDGSDRPPAGPVRMKVVAEGPVEVTMSRVGAGARP